MERVIELRKSELRKNWRIGFGHYYGKDSPSVRAHLGFKNWLNCFGAKRKDVANSRKISEAEQSDGFVPFFL